MDQHRRFPLGALLLIAVAIFASVTAELLPAGLLVPIARDTGTTVAASGLLISAFAISVAVFTIPLTIATRRLDRKPLLVVLLVVLATTTAATALAPGYPSMLLTRVLGGAANGLFWAVAIPFAVRLAPPTHLARAMTVTTLGGSFAFIVGVPLGAALAASSGWRVPFLALAGVLALTAIAAARLLPPVPSQQAERSQQNSRTSSWRALIFVELAVLLVVVGHNSAYNYLSVWLVGGSQLATAGALLAFGIAGAVGASVVGLIGDNAPVEFFITGALLTAVALIALSFAHVVPQIVLPGVLLWGIAFGPLPVLLQTLLYRSVSVHARDIAAAIHTVVFNSAIALGAVLGGLLVEQSRSVIPVVAVGFVLTAGACIFGASLKTLSLANRPASDP